ncbi:unnamed protein product, partial [Rotaria magnacalcarata]
MKKTLKVDIDVSMYASKEILKDCRVIDEISKKVIDVLEKKGQKARGSSIIKASKNAVSLLLSKKKEIGATFLSVYLPMSTIESIGDTVVPTVSSDDDTSVTSVSEDDNINNSDCNSQLSSSSSQEPPISFSMSSDVVKMVVTFEYLFDYFKHSLSMNSKPMNLEKILSDIFTYAFLELKCSVNIRRLKHEISKQISHIVQSARSYAAGRSTIGALRTINQFSLFFKSINRLNEEQPTMGYIQYRNNDDLSPILLTQITFNDTLINKTLSSFDLLRALDVDELSYLSTECALIYDLNLDIPTLEEALKTKILFDRTSSSLSSYFLTVVSKSTDADTIQESLDQILGDDSPSFSVEEMDAIIGRTYDTRGIKRSYE